MSIIKVQVIDQQMIFVNRPVIASGGLHEDIIEFDFSEEWYGYSKAAIFYRENDKTMFVSDIDEITKRTVIPYEVTATGGRVYFGVVGENEGVIYTTELAEYDVVQGAYKISSVINEDVYYSDIAALLRLSGRIYFSVTRNYTNISSDNESTRVLENSHYLEHFDISDKKITSITVKMNDEYITNTAYSEEECTIDIPNVTGYIDISATAETVTWRTVTNILSNITTNKRLIPRDKILDGTMYNATLTPISGYEITSVIITMGGIDVTSTVYSDGHIYIPQVTGDIRITAVANESSVEPPPEETTYSITYNLTGVRSSANISELAEGNTYNTVLTLDSGYDVISTISVTMGGVDITNSAVNENQITIPNVNGNIVITAVASKYYYNVTNYLSNVTTNNNASTVEQGLNYTATITPNSGGTIENVMIRMSGNLIYSYINGVEDWASAAYSQTKMTNGNLTVNIPNVSGDIMISVSASGGSASSYTITRNLTNATSNSNTTSISAGGNHSEVITFTNSDTYIYQVTMGGVDITEDVSTFENDVFTINIPSVTGNVIIDAIGSMSGTYYSVTRDFGKVTNTNNADSIEEGYRYYTIITANSGYKVWSFDLKMGGVSVRNEYANIETAGKVYIIDIPSVTGDIDITAYTQVDNS